MRLPWGARSGSRRGPSRLYAERLPSLRLRQAALPLRGDQPNDAVLPPLEAGHQCRRRTAEERKGERRKKRAAFPCNGMRTKHRWRGSTGVWLDHLESWRPVHPVWRLRVSDWEKGRGWRLTAHTFQGCEPRQAFAESVAGRGPKRPDPARARKRTDYSAITPEAARR